MRFGAGQAELLDRWGRWRRLTDRQAEEAISAWQAFLGVTHSVTRERVSRYQVTDDRGRRGCSLVGVVFDAATATILHTRALTGEDIVHELLHVRYPAWSEAAVVDETQRLLNHEASKAVLPLRTAAPDRATRMPPRSGAGPCSCQASGTFKES